MWSLPDINRMNAEAAKESKQIERALKTGKLGGKKIRCDSAEYDREHCGGEVYLDPWYDIFSDDPKGIIAQCEYHRDHEGPPEGYFYCDGCNRTMVENYTWEMYRHMGDEGILCLPCYAYEIIHDDERWIPLTDVGIEAVTKKQIRKAPHCIGVKMPIPKEIRFVNNVEFDSMDGHCISGRGVEEIKQTLRELQSEGATRALLILDAAYQFAVSIGVYAEAEKAVSA
jgi:hypothetical protein